MSPYHRNVLVELAYNLDHVLWSYGAEIQADPRACLSAQDLTLSDFCRRSLSLVHALVNDDSARRGASLKFAPPSPDEMRLVRRAFDQRKKRDAQQAENDTKAKPAQPAPSQQAIEDDEVDESLSFEPDPYEDEGSQKDLPRPAQRSGVRR